MRGEVTQDNLHLFIPGKIADVAKLMARTTGRPVLECMRNFLASDTGKLLEREETKYWHYSPTQLQTIAESEKKGDLTKDPKNGSRLRCSNRSDAVVGHSTPRSGGE